MRDYTFTAIYIAERVVAMYGRILAAIDETGASVETLRQAARLAKVFNVDLYTISVQEWAPPLEIIGMEVEVPQEILYEDFERIKYQIQYTAVETGVRLKSVVIAKGNAADAILRYIKETGFDFVVLGRRGKGMLHRIRPGSTAHKVVACSPCPIIVLPQAENP